MLIIEAEGVVFADGVLQKIIQPEIDSFMQSSKVWGYDGDKELHDRACQVFAAFLNWMGG